MTEHYLVHGPRRPCHFCVMAERKGPTHFLWLKRELSREVLSHKVVKNQKIAVGRTNRHAG